MVYLNDLLSSGEIPDLVGQGPSRPSARVPACKAGHAVEPDIVPVLPVPPTSALCSSLRAPPSHLTHLLQFPAEERDEIIAAMRGEAKARGLPDTNDVCWRIFIQRVGFKAHETRFQLWYNIHSFPAEEAHRLHKPHAERCSAICLLSVSSAAKA